MDILKTKLSSIILLGFYIAFISAFFTSVTVNSKADQRHVQFGWPLEFIEQNQEQLDPPYPWKLHMGIPQEYPSMILWGALLIDTVFFSLVLIAIIAFLQYMLPGHIGWLKYLRFRYVIAIPIVIIILFIAWAWIAGMLNQNPQLQINP